MSVAPEDVTDEKAFSTFRPGHADYAGCVKYNQSDLLMIIMPYFFNTITAKFQQNFIY